MEACGKLLNCTQALIELYDSMPVLNAIQDYGCGYNHDRDHDHDHQTQIDLDKLGDSSSSSN